MKIRSKLMGRLLCLALCLCMVLVIPLVTKAETCEHLDTDKKDGRCDVCGCLMQDVYLSSISASLEGNIAVNYFMLLSDEVVADENAYMQFTMADGEIIKVPVSQSKLIDGYDVFTCEVAAKEMTDVITSQFYYGGKAAFAKDHVYSVKTYAEHIIQQNSNDPNTKALMEAMVNYGAASQLHFGYNTDNLANTGVTTAPDYSAINITEYPFTSGQGTAKVKLYSASLILNSETTLRLFFNGSITATHEGKDMKVRQRGGLYYVDIVNIAAKDLDDDVTITINDGTNSANITFNPLSYCQIVAKDTTGSYTTQMRDLAIALYLYNKAAGTYFADNGPEGATLKDALHYLSADTNTAAITTKVTSVTFGRSNQYRDIVNGSAPSVLVTDQQDTPATAYYVPNNSGYDVYVLSNDVIYAPEDSTGLFRGMTNVTSIETDNFDVSRVKLAKFMFRQCEKLQTLNTTGWDTSNITDMYGVFYQCYALAKITGIESWDTSAVTTMRGLFRQCGVSGDLDLSAWDVSNVTSMQQLFYLAPNLVNFDAEGWDTGACTEMNYMFAQCSNLKTVNASGWDTSEVTTMYSMFALCGKLVSLDATGWTNSKVTDAINLFMGDTALTTVTGSGGWNFASATKMESMFQDCESLTMLDVANWNMSKAETVWNLFARCKKLVTLNGEENWVLSSATNANFMFQDCHKLEALSVRNWDMSKVAEMTAMFQYCYELEYLDVSKWNTGNCQYFNSTFANCSKLKLDENALVNWNMTSAIRIDHMFDEATSVEALNLSGWNMPNMISTSHMFADCTSLKSIDFTGWNTPKLYSLDAMFNDCDDLTYLDVSSFDTATCEEFSQIFEGCKRLVKIDGLEKWNTNKARTYESTFSGCEALTELDLTTFNTRNVVNDHLMEWQPNPEPNIGRGCYLMFSNMTSLEKLVLGADFSFDGDGKVTTESYKVSLPNPAKIDGNETKWYNAANDTYYTASGIPEKTAATYVAAGATMKDALHYLNGDRNGTKITNKVTSVTFGLKENNLDIVNNNTGVLMNVEQDTPAYVYYILNNGKYDLYFLSNDVIYSPKDSSSLYKGMSALTTVDTTNYRFSRVEKMQEMFAECSALTTLDTTGWDTSRITDLTKVFYKCGVLEKVPGIGGWDMSNVETMFAMFARAYKLKELDVSNWDTGNVTSLYAMFQMCFDLEYLDVADWDVSKVTDFSFLFKGTGNQGDMKINNLDVSNWDTSSAKTFQCMFYGCAQITELDLSTWKTDNLEDLSHMFADCYKLQEVSFAGWNTPKLNTVDALFNHCEAMKSVDVSDLDTANVVEFSQAFEYCYNLEEIIGLDKWVTTSGQDFGEMFTDCSSLKSLDLSSFDTTNAQDSYVNASNGDGNDRFHYFLTGCNSLEKITLGKNFSFDGDGSFTKWTFEMPSATNVNGWDGNWYDAKGNPYAPSAILEETEATYYAVNPVKPENP